MTVNDKQRTEYYHKGQSLKSRFLRLVFRWARLKHLLNKPGFSDRIQKANKPEPPAKLLKDVRLNQYKVNGRNVFKLQPASGSAKKHILFFHGGAYILNFSQYHWKLIANLVKLGNCIVTAPDYPLLPEYSYKERLAMGEQVYKEILLDTPAEDIIIMGDSAGGNLALSLAQKFSLDGVKQPSQIILLSPWLDVSMSNPEMQEVNKRDPILSLSGDSKLGQMHAGDRDIKDFLVSPLYGPLQNLGRISLFTGTDDILNPDARKFKMLTDRTGVPINYYEYEHMVHDWILFPMPEAKLALQQVISLLSNAS